MINSIQKTYLATVMAITVCIVFVHKPALSMVCCYVCMYVCMLVDESVSATAEVSDQVVRVGQFLESLTVTCAIVLGEQLSRKKV